MLGVVLRVGGIFRLGVCWGFVMLMFMFGIGSVVSVGFWVNDCFIVLMLMFWFWMVVIVDVVKLELGNMFDCSVENVR